MASPFDELGNLKDDPEDDGDEDFEDWNHQAIDRGRYGTSAFHLNDH